MAEATAPTLDVRKRILFVDDEPDLLESLRDALRRYRHVWRVDFADGGEAALAALAALEAEPADVVVADMRMPGMDGATLLARVRDRHPTTIRMVLSGYATPQHLTSACRRELPLYVIEQESEGVTHAATGAYLLSLWGLPDGVVEAVAHHHEPGAVAAQALDPVLAVHIANALANAVTPRQEGTPPTEPLDEALLAELGLLDRQNVWRSTAASCAVQLGQL
jgi:CheY-like chemotaxis protein